jgi:hypothetical protein
MQLPIPLSVFLVDKKVLRLPGGVGGSGATGARPDFGVTPDQDLAILRIRVGWRLFYFDHFVGGFPD